MLELKNITYTVETESGEKLDILHDINLTIDERFVAITGPNGGGKSTLAKVIAVLLPPPPVRFYWMVWTLPVYPLPNVPRPALALLSSSRCGLRV